MSQFTHLSIHELEKARSEIDELIEQRKTEAKSNLLADFKQQAKDAGIDFNELIKSKTPSKTLPAKYRDPSNPLNSWTGRGRKPQWLKSKLDAGNTLEEFKV